MASQERMDRTWLQRIAALLGTLTGLRSECYCPLRCHRHEYVDERDLYYEMEGIYHGEFPFRWEEGSSYCPSGGDIARQVHMATPTDE